MGLQQLHDCMQQRATSVFAQGSGVHSWSNIRRKYVALVLSLPVDAAASDLLSFSAAQSKIFKRLNSVFRSEKYYIITGPQLHTEKKRI